MREIKRAPLWLVIVLFQLPGVSFAKDFENEQDCSSIDLRGDKLGPPRDQGQVGDCFLESALDLIHYKTGIQLSVPDAYIQYQNRFSSDADDFKKLAEGGYSGTALRFMKHHDFCLAEDFPNQFTGVLGSKSVKNFYDFASANEYFNQVRESVRIDLLEFDVHPEFPNVSFAELVAIIKANDNPGTWSAIIEKSCGSKRVNISNYRVRPMSLIPFPSTLVFQPFTHGKGGLRAIHKQLKRNNPVIISYEDKIINPAIYNGYHASVVVGRKFNPETKACEILVKNSWGETCDTYSSDIRCENGFYWVKAKALAEVLNDIEFIK